MSLLNFFNGGSKPTTTTPAPPRSTVPPPLPRAAEFSGDGIPFADLSDMWMEVSKTPSRLDKISIFTHFFHPLLSRAATSATARDDLWQAIMLSQGAVAPSYQNLEIGIGVKSVNRCVQSVYGVSTEVFNRRLRAAGDIGELTAQLRGETGRGLIAKAQLTVRGVFRELLTSARRSGKGAAKEREGSLISLLAATQTPSEACFLARICIGSLRMGAGIDTQCDALEQALCLCLGTDRSNEAMYHKVRQLNQHTNNWRENVDQMVAVLGSKSATDAAATLWSAGTIHPLRGVQPMLAQAAFSYGECFSRYGDAAVTCEYKYDGERCQAHCAQNERGQWRVRLFSRNLESLDAKYPEFLSELCRAAGEGVTSFVLDSEAVAVASDGTIMAFQQLARRAKKAAPKMAGLGGLLPMQTTEETTTDDKVDVNVSLFVFDLLVLNGQDITHLSLRERRERLHANIKPIPGLLRLAEGRDYVASAAAGPADVFLHEAVGCGAEGLMVKLLDSTAGKMPTRVVTAATVTAIEHGDFGNYVSDRSAWWCKLKKNYVGKGLSESMDVVVMGAAYGAGKRAGMLGRFCCGVVRATSLDSDDPEYIAVTFVGTGIQDQNLAALTAAFEDMRLDEKPASYTVADSIAREVDVWIPPKVIFEVAAADFALSNETTAGLDAGLASGVSPRFPVYIRTRTDKEAAAATTDLRLAGFFRSQAQVKNNNENDDDLFA